MGILHLSICCFFSLLCGTLASPVQDKGRIFHLESELKKITRRLDDMTEKFNTLLKLYEDSNVNSKDVHQQVQDVWRGGNMTVKDRMVLKRRQRATESDQVAFTAILNQKLTNIPVGTTLVFDFLTRWTDEIISYDKITGVFTCPQSGLYLFSVFIQSATHKEALVQVMMDGQPYSSAVSEPSTDGEDDTGGNLVLLDVKEGSRVWVETTQIDNQSFWPGRTTFSGVLIHRDL